MLLGDLGTDRRCLFTYWASEVGRAESHDHLIPQVGHDASAVWTAAKRVRGAAGSPGTHGDTLRARPAQLPWRAHVSRAIQYFRINRAGRGRALDGYSIPATVDCDHVAAWPDG